MNSAGLITGTFYTIVTVLSESALLDTIAALGNNRAFHRLRIGIGHPGAREQVSPHVLSRPSAADRRLIDLCIEEALHVLPEAVRGNWPIALNRLNSFRAG